MRNRGGQHIPTQAEIAVMASFFPALDKDSVWTMFSIVAAENVIEEQIMDVLEQDYGLSSGKMSVLLLLCLDNDGLRPSELADKISVSRANISAMLKRMERDGLISIVSDSQDERGKYVKLCPQGRDLLSQVLPGHYQRVQKLMQKFSAEERVLLRRILVKLGHND